MFMIQGTKIIIALYTEFIGFELNTYMAAITHDQDQISAFVSFVNITGIVFTIGLGFGNVSRTALSNYVGKKKHIQAKNVQLFYLLLVSIVGTIMFVVLVSASGPITKLYSNLENIDFWLRNIILIYSIGALGEMISGTLNTTLRVANRTGSVVVIVLITFVVELVSLSYLFAFVANMKVLGLV